MSNGSGLAAFASCFAKSLFGAFLCCVVLVEAVWGGAPETARSWEQLEQFSLTTGDVVAFIGGGDVAAQAEAGHLETLLAARFPDALFRNFGWEGDTVFNQPREVGFPDLATSLRKAGTTVLVLQFGRIEALDGSKSVSAFKEAYSKLLTKYGAITPRLLLVAPCPYEKASEPLPDLSTNNVVLAAYVQAIQELARERRLPVLDLFNAFGGPQHSSPRLTENGLHLTNQGQGLVALAFAWQIGLEALTRRAGKPGRSGAWETEQFEALRQRIIAKNRLWFHYYRPQNWAFLGGDRTSQPSSRDHRDPKKRWFPEEMERFVPLIRGEEEQIKRLALSLQ